MHKAVRRSLWGILPFSITELTSEIKNHCIYFSTKRPKSPVIPHFSGVEILSTFAYIFTVEISAHRTCFCRSYRCFLFYWQSLHQPSEFPLWNKSCFIRIMRSFVFSIFKPFIQQHKSVLFPQQRLDTVTAFTAEQEQTAGKYIKLEILLYNCC